MAAPGPAWTGAAVIGVAQDISLQEGSIIACRPRITSELPCGRVAVGERLPNCDNWPVIRESIQQLPASRVRGIATIGLARGDVLAFCFGDGDPIQSFRIGMR